MAGQDPRELQNILSDGMVIKPGFLYAISVVPTVTVTDSSALKMPLEKRNCLSKDESQNLVIFKTYSQTSCLFECQLRLATHSCNCTKWDYPKVDERYPTCVDRHAYDFRMPELSSTDCFDTAMKKPVRLRDCDCPNDCDYIQYSLDTRVMPYFSK